MAIQSKPFIHGLPLYNRARFGDQLQGKRDAFDFKTCKFMTVQCALYPKNDTDHLQLARTIEGCGLLQVKQAVKGEIRGLNDQIKEGKRKC